MDFQSVLAEMGKCQELGLTKSIGVSNFSCKKMENLLVTAKIVPAFNQVEMNIVWQQRKLSEFCMTKGITMTGYSPLGTIGTSRRSNRVMGNKVVKETSKTKGKTHSQVCLRWLYERGVILVVKSFSEESMKENLEIFEWELTEEQNKEISQLPQRRGSRRYGMEKPDHKTSLNHVFLRSSVSMLLCAQRGFNYSKL